MIYQMQATEQFLQNDVFCQISHIIELHRGVDVF